jgi:ribosomal RNA-processing protein 12
MEAVLKHEAIQNYSGHKDPTVNDIAHSLKSFSMGGGGGEDDMMSESNVGTFKTFQTFASNFSACTNLSFSK